MIQPCKCAFFHSPAHKGITDKPHLRLRRIDHLNTIFSTAFSRTRKFLMNTFVVYYPSATVKPTLPRSTFISRSFGTHRKYLWLPSSIWTGIITISVTVIQLCELLCNSQDYHIAILEILKLRQKKYFPILLFFLWKVLFCGLFVIVLYSPHLWLSIWYQKIVPLLWTLC